MSQGKWSSSWVTENPHQLPEQKTKFYYKRRGLEEALTPLLPTDTANQSSTMTRGHGRAECYPQTPKHRAVMVLITLSLCPTARPRQKAARSQQTAVSCCNLMQVVTPWAAAVPNGVSLAEQINSALVLGVQWLIWKMGRPPSNQQSTSKAGRLLQLLPEHPPQPTGLPLAHHLCSEVLATP